MEEKIFEGLKYLVSYPEGFREDKKYPLVIFLHGAGTRSENTEILRKNVPLNNIIKHQDARGYVVLAPLCNGINWDEWMTVLIHLVGTFRELPYIDVTRVHITGLSMGGYGTWSFSILRPDWFASAMPVCGSGSGFARNLAGLPIRTFHGLCDTTVEPLLTLQMARAVNMAGGYAEAIFFPGNGHDIWEEVYNDDRNYDWLFSFTTERNKSLAEELSGNYYG
jgi:predicted peptidase